MSFIVLRVTGDRSVFDAINTEGLEHFYVEWEVDREEPLGAWNHLAGLRRALSRQNLDDLAFFRMDPDTAEAIPDGLVNPSLTCDALQLHDACFLYASTNAFSLLGVSAVEAALSGEAVPWPILSGSAFRFSKVGQAVSTHGPNHRAVRKRPRPAHSHLQAGFGPADETAVGAPLVDWEGSVVVANAALDSNTTDRFSLRIRTEGDGDNEAARPWGSVVPHVAVGVSDGEIPLDEILPQHRTHRGAFMLDVMSGAVYVGGQRRPSFVDPHSFRSFDGMVLTFALDTDTGVLNIFQNGKAIFGTTVPAEFADSLYPCAELYSPGSLVEFV